MMLFLSHFSNYEFNLFGCCAQEERNVRRELNAIWCCGSREAVSFF